jgi:hypothetical protein
LVDSPDFPSLAERRAEKARKAKEDAEANLALFRAEQRAIEERTARLRALRLARDAAEAVCPGKLARRASRAAASRSRERGSGSRAIPGKH